MSILHNLVSVVLLFTLAHGLPPLQNSTGFESNELPEATNEINYRLPTDVMPTHYIIKLEPNLKVDEFSFEGTSSINISVLTSNKKMITLHAKNLAFDEGYTTLVGMNSSVKPVIQSIDNVTDFFTVVFETPIAVGSYLLNFKYTGLLNDYHKGLFKTSYDNKNGEKVWLAATQLSPTYARQAFPCFDEPAMKAKFEISIKHFDNYTAISNMPALNEITDEDDSRKKWTNFAVTPVMSTYLIAFVISDFKNLSSEDGRIRCWSQQNNINQCRYALNVGKMELEALEDYTGRGHVIPKLDNVIIPSFASVAMENWGLVTYREDKILYEEGVTTTSGEKLIVETLAHEFAHQWFGNLVTPAWWDHLFLSEGFAHYFQYFIADKVKPNWRMMEQMVVESLQFYALRAMDYVVNDEHPINTKVNSPSEIVKIFDVITYYKGGCVIRMISHVLTDNVFQTGLRQYFKIKEYGSSTLEDLFNVLASTTENFPKNMSLKEFLHSWMDQASYPVVHVTRHLASPGHVLMNQTQFSSLHTTDKTNTNIWWIPVNYAIQSNPNFNETQPSHWLEPNRHEQEVPLQLSDNEWFIVNKQQTGLYRVNYDEENWILIADYLNTPNYTNIHVLNRAQLLDDSFNLVENGYLDDYSVFLNISRYLSQEDDYIAWYPAFRAFEFLNKALKNTETHKLFKLYILKLIENLENRVGYYEKSDDDHLTKDNRINLIQWACKMGSVKCINATRKSVIEHVSGLKKISTSLQEIVLCEGVRTANMTIWNKAFDSYFEAKNKNEQKSIFFALGCSSDSNIIKSYLAKVIDPDFKVRRDQDPSYQTDYHLYTVTDGNEAGVDIILDFVKENFVALNETRPLGYKPYVDAIVSAMSTDDQIDKLSEIRLDVIKKVVNKSRTVIHDNYMKTVDWLKEHEPQIRSFLLLQKLVNDTMTI